MPDSLLTLDSPEVRHAREVADSSWAYRASRTLQVAQQVGIFRRIGQAGATSGAIAADLKIRPDMTEKLLVACAAMGLVQRDPQRPQHWRMSEKGRTTLLPESAYYQGHTIGHMASVWATWNDLEQTVRGLPGSGRFDEAAGRGARNHEDFIMAMHGLAVAGQAAQVASRLDLAGRKRLIDIGGGPGTYSIALCQKHPDLSATVFDLPETLVFTRRVIEQYGMQGRVRTVTGDWDAQDFGTGYDVLLMSNVLHGPSSGAPDKLAKAHRALVWGAMLVVQDFVLDRDRSGPLRAALFAVMLDAYDIGELTSLIGGAGFTDCHHEALPEVYGTTLITARR
jgi:hypothetical protein